MLNKINLTNYELELRKPQTIKLNIINNYITDTEQWFSDED